MDTPIKDGGPAFPTPDVTYPNSQVQFGQNGMTLRDYFAGQALAAQRNLPCLTNSETGPIFRNNAETCYAQADAMLAAREPKPEAAS